jgi:hypothetical protein
MITSLDAPIVTSSVLHLLEKYKTSSYLAIVKNNLLPNCPISQRDIIAAEDIFGPKPGSLKGKTTCSASEHIQANHVNISINIMSQYRDVTIAGIVMFVNKVPFFMTISRHIKFGMAEMSTSQKAVMRLAAIEQVKLAYMK